MILPTLVSMLFLAALPETPSSATGPAETFRPVPAKVNRLLILQLVNDVRRKGCKCGDTYYYPVAPVSWNDKLEVAATTHSTDMFRNNFFNHTAPNGSKGGVRIERAGYNWKAYGENIAAGYDSERDVVQGWINSPGHCKNLMNRLYTEMGVARMGKYWTQEFGTR